MQSSDIGNMDEPKMDLIWTLFGPLQDLFFVLFLYCKKAVGTAI